MSKPSQQQIWNRISFRWGGWRERTESWHAEKDGTIRNREGELRVTAPDYKMARRISADHNDMPRLLREVWSFERRLGVAREWIKTLEDRIVKLGGKL